jgi:hypothetical protein
VTRRGFLILAAGARDASIARVAERELSACDYLLVRSSDAAVSSSRWPRSDVPAPLASLVKPFLALAYGESNGFRYPEFECAGCWLPGGHGRIGVGAALAQSCNAYFEQLAARTDREQIARTVSRFGLPMPSVITPETLVGRHGSWRAAPLAAVLAYRELHERRRDPGGSLVLASLRNCARSGTAAGARANMLAKTGTALCVHRSGAPADGLLMALFPSESPEFVLLVRSHGVTGAECARRAGVFLRMAAR